MSLFSFLILAAVARQARPEETYLRVKTLSGAIQGYLGQSCRLGTPFAGFRGIPYAEPPLGTLRFKDPVPKTSWNDTWDGTIQRCSCLQGSEDDSGFPADAGYSEDCLYLNVYTPNLRYLRYGSGEPVKAVMVFIHPGAFNVGTTSESVTSPDFLIDQDVVVVTMNYRLGALGFLSLQNAEVPGNAGLKDQNLALRWVKDNIKFFGGDPDKVTIFGESAGSASVHFHMLSESSRGLFRGAIMQSGTALAPWAYSPPELALKKAFRLGRNVGCKQTDASEMLECLQKVSGEEVIEAQQTALTLGELLTLRIIAFHPTTEPPVEGAFLTGHPFDLMHAGNFTKVPSIIGSNSDEALLLYPKLMEEDPHGYLVTMVGMDLSRFAPYQFHIKPFTKAAIHVHLQISRYYFNGKFITKALLKNMLELLTDVEFVLPIQLTTRLLADASIPVYNYRFSYDGGYNILKMASNMTHLQGASHGDDLGYLFYTPRLHRHCGNPTEESLADELTVDRMTRMWTAFAKTGDPTPEADPETKWMPFTSEDKAFLEIGENLAPSRGLKRSNMIFWEELVKDLIDLSKAGREAIDDLELSEEVEI